MKFILFMIQTDNEDSHHKILIIANDTLLIGFFINTTHMHHVTKCNYI